jgi:hypothetical protein
MIQVRARVVGDGGDILLDAFDRPRSVPLDPGQAVTVGFPPDSVMVRGAGEGLPTPVSMEEDAA